MRIVVVLLMGLVAASALSSAGPAPQPAQYVEGQLLVRFKPGVSSLAMSTAHGRVGAGVVRTFQIVENLQLVKLPPTVSLKEALAHYRQDPNVLYAEQVAILRTAETFPTDPRFGDLWGLHNTGQLGGTADADIDAPQAWDITRGSASVVVAVIDTGIDYQHEDLAANMWRNPADCDSDGIDDDGNGYSDDCYGIDTYNFDTDPLDDNGHGTHVAGTIGAVGSNAVGVVGVTWAIQLLACKFLNEWGWGTLEGALACLEYVAIMKDRGVNIIATNNSWGGFGFYQSLFDAIAAHLHRGILFMAAAGNSGVSHDKDPDFFAPSGYYLPNIIAVAATTRMDTKAFFSDYGRHTVHLGAPGDEILSTIVGNQYETFSGTSMATPHVTGVAALLAAQDPSRTWIALKNLILAGGDTQVPDTITGRRLNSYGALSCAGSVVLARLRPSAKEILADAGTPLTLAALHINCATPAGDVTVTITPGGESVTLRDDGMGFDQVAGDGIYSGQWTPTSGGTFTLTFPDGDPVTVKVLQSYTYAPASARWREIVGTNLNLEDESFAALTSPFPILFGGISFDLLFVSDNGFVSFTDPYLFEAWLNEPLPTPRVQTLVAPFWDDLYPIGRFSPQNVFWEVRGTPPNRELVIEWRNLRHWWCQDDPEATVRFQLVFFEGRSDILFQYADTTFGKGLCTAADRGGSATSGIQVGGKRGSQFSYNSPALRSNQALLWSPVAPGCTGVAGISSREVVTYRGPRQLIPIIVTVTNHSGAPRTLTAIAPQPEERFTVARVYPRLPVTLRSGRTQRFLVLTRGPATGPFPVVATSPYFMLTLDCGTLPSAGRAPGRGLHSELRGRVFSVAVSEAGIGSVHLRLFDLSGRVRLDVRSTSPTLTVPLVAEDGSPLANGVYLYVVTLYGEDGTPLRTEVHKLALTH